MRMQARRSVCLLMVLVLALSMSLNAFAAGSDLSVSLAEPAKNQGSVQILVNADKAGTVGDGKLTVTYDAAVLEFRSAEPGSAWPEGSDVSLKVNASKEGQLIVAFASVYEADKGDAVVLNFTALKEGETKVTVKDAAGSASDLAVTVECPSAQYTDVKAGAWYHEGVDYAIVNGYMNGTSKTLFTPNGEASRAMMITVLYRHAGSPDVSGQTNPFTDLKAGWYKDAITWAYNAGISTGTAKDKFSPDATMTRQEFAALLYRYAGVLGVSTDAKADLGTFTDSDKVASWASDAMSWAVANGLLGSTSTKESLLSPKAVTTRGQVAKVLRDFDLNVMG